MLAACGLEAAAIDVRSTTLVVMLDGCRADAVGVPGGEDFGDRIYLKRINPKETFSHG